MKVSKFIKPNKDILLEYIYDDNNNIGESYRILVNSKNSTYSYVSVDTSSSNNISSNQLFQIDPVTINYGIVNTSDYSFLQFKDYSSGFPIRYDSIKIHLPINYTFGENIGMYIRVYTYDYENKNMYDLSNFFFDVTNVDQSYILNYTSPPFIFQEKLWGKNITINFPSIFAVANQRQNGSIKANSVNYNLTNGVGLSLNSPIFVDFSFITTSKTINSTTTYYLTPKSSMSFAQTPDFEKLGVKIDHSINGDYFEIYGIYNDNIAEFKNFINNSVQLGNRYYVEYTITLYEQNIRGKSIKMVMTDNFNEKIEYRPIIKYSTTTAIIDVEMNVIDSVDDSSIYRRASYGMLQDEVAKYSINLTKINISNANKPKIYNIKSAQGAGIFGNSALPQMSQKSQIILEPIKINYTVLSDRYNVVAKSENVIIGSKKFFGMGKLKLLIQPFDNIIQLIIAQDVSNDQILNDSGGDSDNELANAPVYMDMTNMGEIKLVIKNTQISFETTLYMTSNQVDLANGVVVFKLPSSRINDIRKVYDSGINVFYITGTMDANSSVIYSGLFILYDSPDNILNLNTQANQLLTNIAEKPAVIIDSGRGTAIVTRKPISTISKVSPTTVSASSVSVASSAVSSTKVSNVVFQIENDSSININGYNWTGTQIKAVLGLDFTPTMLSIKDVSVYSNDKFLANLNDLSNLLQKTYLNTVDSINSHKQVTANFKDNNISNVSIPNISPSKKPKF